MSKDYTIIRQRGSESRRQGAGREEGFPTATGRGRGGGRFFFSFRDPGRAFPSQLKKRAPGLKAHGRNRRFDEAKRKKRKAELRKVLPSQKKKKKSNSFGRRVFFLSLTFFEKRNQKRKNSFQSGARSPLSRSSPFDPQGRESSARFADSLGEIGGEQAGVACDPRAFSFQSSCADFSIRLPLSTGMEASAKA